MKNNTAKGPITVLGIDLAKQSFQLHGVNAGGEVVLKKKLNRKQLSAFMANLPVCLIGLEACGGAHHWVRVFTEMGHTVRMMAPQFVKPYVKSNKNDAVDAEAICEAVQRPNMRFVPAKSIEQQDLQSIHRIRSQLVARRTAQANQIRGLLYIRTLLIHGGRSVVRCAHKHQDKRSQWIGEVEQRRGKNITAVAVANKNARIVWALLTKKEDYQAKVA